MLLKISKMTPQCPKRLPGDEYTGESQLSGDEYTRDSRLPSDEYTGSLNFPVMNTLGILNSPVMNTQGVSTPLWWIHRGVDFLVYFEQA